MHITHVRFLRVTGTWDYEGPLGEARSASPLDGYNLAGRPRRSWPIPNLDDGPPYTVRAVFLFIETDSGPTGTYGPVSGSEARTIAGRFARILIGEDPHAIERIWDRMYRGAVDGRKGPTMAAISKVDLALWDLKGKLLGAPVYEILGGPTRESVRAYASMLGYSVEPERAALRAREAVEEGYTAIKWFFRYQPVHGPEGIRKNLDLIRAVREAVGPDVEIMFDAWKSWDVPYTRRMAELASDERPWWFEEPVMPDMISQYSELRRTVSTVAIAGGEHEYTRWGMQALLDAEAVDILQPDPTWCGGLSEASKICALASSRGVPVIPHHGGWASTHLIASQTPTVCPIQEWLIQAGRRDSVFLKEKLEPIRGEIRLPTSPGLGVDLDQEAVEEQEELEFRS
jgi:L-alanine-DL-glutamate epimerase-like enolase superfamily enzyme